MIVVSRLRLSRAGRSFALQAPIIAGLDRIVEATVKTRPRPIYGGGNRLLPLGVSGRDQGGGQENLDPPPAGTAIDVKPCPVTGNRTAQEAGIEADVTNLLPTEHRGGTRQPVRRF